MRSFIAPALLLLPVVLFSQDTGRGVDNQPNTIAALPLASNNAGRIFWVSNGATLSDCTTGGGSFLVACKSNGTTWVAITIGGSGTASYSSLTGAPTDSAALASALNSKQPTLTVGNLTETTSSVLNITGGTGSVIGTGLSLQVKQATGSVSGYLSSADWNAFLRTTNTATQALSGPITAPQINGEMFIDGTTNTTLNAAFTLQAAKSFATTIKLGPGVYGLTSQMTEPEQAQGVSIIGAGSNITTIQATSSMTAMLYKGDTAQGSFTIQGVTFQCNSGATVNAQYGLQWLWARGFYLKDVQVNNCGTEDVAFGGGIATHLFTGTVQDLSTDYNESVFTGPSGGGGATPPAYGLHLYTNAYDSEYFNVLVRNAHTASLRIDATATNNAFHRFHGFGDASSGVLPYAPNYILEDASGGNRFYETYFDGPKVSSLHFAMTGSSANDIVEGGSFYWRTGTSWPSTVNFGSFDRNYDDFTIRDLWCSGMTSGNTWTVNGSPGFTLYGVRLVFDGISGCAVQMNYSLPIQYRNYNWGNVSGLATFTFSGTAGFRNTSTQNASIAWKWTDKNSANMTWINDYGQLYGPDAYFYGTLNASSLATPSPTVTPTGTVGSTTYSYVVQAFTADQSTHGLPSSTITIANGNATLNSTNYNAVSWAAIPGAWGYKVYRTAGGATQGNIVSGTPAYVTTTSFNDTGLVGDLATAASTNNGGVVTATIYQGQLATPASSTANCTTGQFWDDASYHYVCTATNTIKRVALTTF